MSKKTIKEIARYSISYENTGFPDEKANTIARIGIAYALREMERVLESTHFDGVNDVEILDYNALTITYEGEDKRMRFAVKIKQEEPEADIVINA